MADLLQADLTIAALAGAGGLCAIVCAVVCCWRDFARRNLRAHDKERELALAAVQKAIPGNPSCDPTVVTGRLLGYQAPVKRLDPFMQYKRLGNNPEKLYRLTTAAMPSASSDKLARAYGSLSGTVHVDDSPPTPSAPSRAPQTKRSHKSAAADLEEGMRINSSTTQSPSRGSSAWSKQVDRSRTSSRDAARVAKPGSVSAALERELGVTPLPGDRAKAARSRHRDESRVTTAAGGHNSLEEQQVVGRSTTQGTMEVSVTPLPRPAVSPADAAALALSASKTASHSPKAASSAGAAKALATVKSDIAPAQLPVGASESTLESQDGGSASSTTSSSSSEDEGTKAKTIAERRPPQRGPTASTKASAALQSDVLKGGSVDVADLLGQIELPSHLAGRSAPNRRGGEQAKGDRQAKFDALDAEVTLEATLEARLNGKVFPNTYSGLPLSRPAESGKARKGAASSRGSTPSRGRQVSGPLKGVGFVQPTQ